MYREIPKKYHGSRAQVMIPEQLFEDLMKEHDALARVEALPQKWRNEVGYMRVSKSECADELTEALHPEKKVTE